MGPTLPPATKMYMLKSCLYPVPQKMTVFGGRAFEEIIKLKWGHKGRPWYNLTGVFIRRENSDTQTRDMLNRKKAFVRKQREETICKPRRGAWEEIEPAGTLISDLQPPEP